MGCKCLESWLSLSVLGCFKTQQTTAYVNKAPYILLMFFFSQMPRNTSWHGSLFSHFKAKLQLFIHISTIGFADFFGKPTRQSRKISCTPWQPHLKFYIPQTISIFEAVVTTLPKAHLLGYPHPGCRTVQPSNPSLPALPRLIDAIPTQGTADGAVLTCDELSWLVNLPPPNVPPPEIRA